MKARVGDHSVGMLASRCARLLFNANESFVSTADEGLHSGSALASRLVARYRSTAQRRDDCFARR
jgi:hypothetical protein